MSVGPSYLWPFPVPEDDPTVVPPVAPALPLVPQDVPPPAPVYQTPDLLSAPPAGFRERLAMGLPDDPAFRVREGTSPAMGFLGGLLDGASRGFKKGTVGAMKQAEEERERVNTSRKAEADRTYENQRETWKARLRKHYDADTDAAGKVRITAELAAAAGYPESAVGTLQDLDKVTTQMRAQSTARAAVIRDQPIADVLGMSIGDRIPGDLMVRARTYLKTPREKAPREPKEKPVALQWTPTGRNQIALAESEVSKARASGDPQAERAALVQLDELRKRDFAAQLRMATSLEQASALAQQALASYPEWRNSPMINLVVEDVANAFRAGTAGSGE